MGRRIVVLLVLGLLLCSQVYASPVNLPNGLKGKEGLFITKELAQENNWYDAEQCGISASFVFDNFSRKIKGAGEDRKVNANFYGGQVGLTLLNRFDLYALFGDLNNAELKGNILGYRKIEFKDEFMWGVGLSAMIYEWEKTGIGIFGDANYRQAKDIGAEPLPTIDEFGIGAKAKWDEWQVALGVSKKFKYFIPYVGVKYSDIKTSGELTSPVGTFGLGSAKSKGKVGPFIGVSILPIKGVSIDLGGRFIDETAFSAKASVRF
jgi:hypothetical protein